MSDELLQLVLLGVPSTVVLVNIQSQFEFPFSFRWSRHANDLLNDNYHVDIRYKQSNTVQQANPYASVDITRFCV